MSGRMFFPLEIIEPILLRSPAKSLGRFKSVSKTWNSLISNPRFVNAHLHHRKIIDHRHSNNKLLSLSITTRTLYSIEFNLLHSRAFKPAMREKITFGSPPMRLEKIPGTCNTLILARDVNNDAMFFILPTTHYVIRKLPVNHCKPLFKPFPAWDYAFYRFGYDSSTNDYKVVCIWNHSSVSIYSLRNNSWRKLPNVPHNELYDRNGCALVNDKYHWLSRPLSIIAFSFTDELFTEIKLPDSIQNNGLWNIDKVVEFGGRLGFYGYTTGPEGVGVKYYELWVMQEYDDARSWTKERKDKTGDRIASLQQLVSPYSKTYTASVLHEATDYINFLHEQVKVLSDPYLHTSPTALTQELKSHDLNSKGLLLVPVSYISGVASSNGAEMEQIYGLLSRPYLQNHKELCI